MPITYDRRAGSYRGENGRFVARAEVLRLLDGEAARLEVRLRGHARLLTTNRISLSEFQARMAEDLKLSHLRSAALGSGGRKGLSNRHFGKVGQELKEQYQFLRGFGDAIAAGELSEAQILARAKSYGISTRTAFFEAEKITRQENGFNLGKRTLDPQASHCPDCLRYSTNGQWVPIEQIVPPGVNCQCRGRCRCSVAFKRSVNLSDRLPIPA